MIFAIRRWTLAPKWHFFPDICWLYFFPLQLNLLCMKRILHLVAIKNITKSLLMIGSKWTFENQRVWKDWRVWSSPIWLLKGLQVSNFPSQLSRRGYIVTRWQGNIGLSMKTKNVILEHSPFKLRWNSGNVSVHFLCSYVSQSWQQIFLEIRKCKMKIVSIAFVGGGCRGLMEP